MKLMSKNVSVKTEKSKCISFYSTVCISYGQIDSECKVICSAAVMFVQITEGRE